MKIFYWLQSKRTENKLEIKDLIYIYCLGGLIGNLYETILFYFMDHEYINSSASVIGPFNVVYGFGIALLTICLYRIGNWLIIWLLGALISGFSEFCMSLFEEKVLGISSWNYSHLLMNFEGRTTFPLAICWGLAGMIIIVFIMPFILQLLHKIPRKFSIIVAVVLTIYVTIDLSLSFVSLYRYSQRMHGIENDNAFFKWIDQVFNDDYMRQRFPKLSFK